jgi:hypothetical protein
MPEAQGEKLSDQLYRASHSIVVQQTITEVKQRTGAEKVSYGHLGRAYILQRMALNTSYGVKSVPRALAEENMTDSAPGPG